MATVAVACAAGCIPCGYQPTPGAQLWSQLRAPPPPLSRATRALMRMLSIATHLLLRFVGGAHLQRADPVCAVCMSACPVLSHPSPLHTHAGQPCCSECAFADLAAQQCVASCGHPCRVDADCGTWPDSPCPSCDASGTCTGNADFGNCQLTNATAAPDPPADPVFPSAWNASFYLVNYTDASKTDAGPIW